MDPWRTRSRRTLVDLSPWLSVEERTVELPDGRVIDDWPWVESREFANVVAVTEDGRFLVLRQTKYAVEGPTLGSVGGYLEPDEDPVETAKRELREETGYDAPEWRSLGRYAVDGNRGCGVGHLFLAEGASKVAEPNADDLEEQELLLLTRAEVEEALLAGAFGVLSWAAVVALALVALDRDRPEPARAVGGWCPT
ncbi:MAG TPA: NUDIX hydrolase [Gaiella sp.]|jgi:8-oxo-dGTP pyrophosphatase MutT (NUDIX family)|nr:NUDIX hydrolase [Gaiella sp.]